MSTEALVPAQQAGMVTFGGEEVNTLPLIISNIKLVSSNSKNCEAGNIGEFFCGETQQNFKELFTAPLHFQTKRVLYPEGQFGAEPLCRSNDGKVPAEGVIDKRSHTCATCPVGPKLWKDYRKTKKKPDCDEVIEYTFVDLISLKVYRMNISGTSLSEIKNAMKRISQEVDAAKLVAKFKAKKGEQVDALALDFDSFVVRLKPRKAVNERNGTTYFMIEFAVSPAAKDDVEAFREIYQDIRNRFHAQRFRSQQTEDVNEAEAQIEGAMGTQGAVSGATGEPTIEP